MAKTATNSFGSDKSGIVIWKHNTMGHMDNGVEEQIALLVKKQQEGVVNSTALLSFASESGVVDKPKRGFLKRFFGKKEAAASPAPAPDSGMSLVMQDKSSSFETNRSRASSQEDVRSGKTDFRVFRDGKGAAVVALADGRNYPALAQRAREAGFPDLARQIETAVPRQPRAVTRASRKSTKSATQPSASEIIDRVRARNQERLGRSSGSGTTEAERHGEIPIRSVEDLKAHRAELARNRSHLASVRHLGAPMVEGKAKAVEEASKRCVRADKSSADPTEPLERSVLVSAWLQSGNITGNPVLYPDTSPDAPGVPTSMAPSHPLAVSPEAPLADVLLEGDTRRLFSQKGSEDPRLASLGIQRNWGVGTETGEREKLVGSNNGRVHDDTGPTGFLEVHDGVSKRKASPVLTRSPLSKPLPLGTPFLGAHPNTGRGGSVRVAPGESLGGAKALTRVESEMGGLVQPARSLAPSPELSRTPNPEPALPFLNIGTPLASPVKGAEVDSQRASASGLPWPPMAMDANATTSLLLLRPQLLPAPMDDDVAAPRMMTRQASSKSEGRQEASPSGDGERYDPAQWHKYLQERSAQVLPNLGAEPLEEVAHSARAGPPRNETPHPIQALPLPLPPDLHRLPCSLGPPGWAYHNLKAREAKSVEGDASGGATPRSSASCSTEPHSPSSPLRDLLLSPHGHTLEVWHATSTCSG